MNIFSWVWSELKAAVGDVPATMIVLAVSFAAIRFAAIGIDMVFPGKGYGARFRGVYQA